MLVFLLILCSALVLAWSVAAPRGFAALACLLFVFERSLAKVTGISAITGLAEVVALWAVILFPLRRLASHRRLRGLPGLRWFGIYALIGLGSGLLAGEQWIWCIEGLWLAIKGVAFGFAIAQLDWGPRHLRATLRAISGLVAFALTCSLVELMIPQRWADVLQTSGYVEYVGRVPSLIGPFVHPTEFAQVMELCTLALLAWRLLGRKSPGNLLLIVGSLAGVLLSFRRAAVVGAALSVLVLLALHSKTRTIFLTAIAVPVAAVLLWGPLIAVASKTYHEYVVLGQSQARTVMTQDAFHFADQNFPLGAGFGRFGGAVAQSHYSPLYVQQGYTHIYGLEPSPPNNNYLTDTQWPQVIGEGGYLGLTAFVAGLAMVFQLFWRSRRSTDTYLRLTANLGITWMVVYLVESTSNPVFLAPPTFPFLFALSGLMVALREQAVPQEGRRAKSPRSTYSSEG